LIAQVPLLKFDLRNVTANPEAVSNVAHCIAFLGAGGLNFLSTSCGPFIPFLPLSFRDRMSHRTTSLVADSWLARVSLRCCNWAERWFPDTLLAP
jgi:hypothetical protein